jgi:hypothetical protein
VAESADALIEQAAKALDAHVLYGAACGCGWRVLDGAVLGESLVDRFVHHLAESVLAAVAPAIEATALNEGRARYAAAWDDGVDAAFRGAVMRQNASDVKRANPYREQPEKEPDPGRSTQLTEVRGRTADSALHEEGQKKVTVDAASRVRDDLPAVVEPVDQLGVAGVVELGEVNSSTLSRNVVGVDAPQDQAVLVNTHASTLKRPVSGVPRIGAQPASRTDHEA